MKVRFFFIFIFILFVACSNKRIRSDEGIRIQIDSIYVNELEKGDTVRYRLMVVYYCTINNSNDSVINIPFKNYLSEGESEANSYLVYEKDTLDLFLGTHSSIKIPPKGEIHFGLMTNTIDMVNLFEKNGYSFEHHPRTLNLSEVDFLKKIVKESSLFFAWPGYAKTIKGLEKIKTKYRDPKDENILE